MTTTLVTCLHDLQKRNVNQHRTVPWMLENGRAVLELPQELVIFTDPELAGLVADLRKDRPTRVVADCPLEELLDPEIRRQIEASRLQGNARREKVTHGYVELMWAKYAMLKHAMLYPVHFKTGTETERESESEGRVDKVGWIDFAIAHVAKVPPDLAQILDEDGWLREGPRIRAHALRLFDDRDVCHPSYWENVQGHLAGGLVVGDRPSMWRLTDLFFEAAKKALGMGLAPLDEGVLSYVAGTHPDLFALSYGDYEDILRNHDRVRGGHQHLGWMLNDARERGKSDRDLVAAIGSAAIDEAASQTSARPLPEGRPLLGLCMIVKNEAPRIAEVLSTFRPVIDRWTILDTGSTDGTQDIVRRELAGVPGQLHEEPFVDFSTSRNRALALHGTQTTFAILPNGDLLEGAQALRDFLEAHAKDHATAYKIRIAPGHYFHPFVVRTGCGWHYEGRTHECLMGSGAGPAIDGARLLRDRSSRTSDQWRQRWQRDLGLLQADLADSPTNPRPYFYLGQTHECLGEHEAALRYFEQRAKMGGYFDECFEAKLRVGKMLEKVGTWGGALEAFLEAHAFDPRRAEPLACVAEHYHAENSHALAYLFASRAAALPKPPTDLFLDEHVYEVRAHDLAAISAFYAPGVPRGEGRRHALAALRARPGDERLRANYAFYVQSAAELFRGTRTQGVDFAPEPPYTASTPSILRLGLRHGDRWLCVVRTVNYKIDGGRYVMPPGDDKIRTRNYVLELDRDLDGRFSTRRAIEVADRSDRVRTDYVISGYEDCRLFDHDGDLYFTATVCDLTDDGQREIVLAHLGDDYAVEKVVPLRGPWSSQPQKNWMPIVASGGPLRIVYAAQHGTILEVDPNEGVLSEPSQVGHGRLRGGSQAIEVEGSLLYLVHDVAFPGSGRMYLHRFVQADRDGKISAMTDPFYFEQLGIEFCAGLARAPGRGGADQLVASYSVHDASSRLATFDLERVLGQLKTDYVV